MLMQIVVTLNVLASIDMVGRAVLEFRVCCVLACDVSISEPRSLPTLTAACTHRGRVKLWDAVSTAAAIVLVLHLQANDGGSRRT